MSLKRTNNYPKAFFYLLVALALLAYEGLIIAHLAGVSTWGALVNPFIIVGLPSLLVLIALTLLTIIWPVMLIWRERRLRLLAQNDPFATPPTAYQPDKALALRDGETLTLGWQKKRSLGARLLALAVLALTAECLFVPLLPSVVERASNLFDSLIGAGELITHAHPDPTPFDWLVVAFPFVLAMFAGVGLIISSIRRPYQRIVADDQGITLSSPFSRQFIPWNDIAVFARPYDPPGETIEGEYIVWGRTHGIILTLRSRQGVSAPQGRPRIGAWQVTFEGGYDAYLYGARRLLATIAARSYLPLSTVASSTMLINRLKRRFPVSTLELGDALGAPEADATLQPRPEEVHAVPPFDVSVNLTTRIALRAIVGEALLWVLVVVFSLWLWFMFMNQLYPAPEIHITIASVFADNLISIATYATILIAAPPMGYGLAYLHRRHTQPRMLANDTGITTRDSATGTFITIPWAAIRAWALVRASSRPPTYLIFTDDQKVHWVEPPDAQLAGRGVKGDRREAYRKRAEELHALIVARTGLSLREIQLTNTRG